MGLLDHVKIENLDGMAAGMAAEGVDESERTE